MTTVAAQVTAAGIIAPSYADVLQQLKNAYWGIYGTDADLSASTQDGQFLAVLAQIVYDNNQLAVATYNQFSPQTAQGAGLSAVVKVNGIARKIATNSQAIVTVTGQNGTVIANGLVGDSLGLNTVWALPASVTIPPEGEIDVTATSTSEGDVAAAAASLTSILTPTLGWQSVTNEDAAIPGDPVESDADLRRRQSASVSLAALTVDESIFAAVDSVAGVRRLALYENDGDATDADGIPSHSISLVVLGGDVQEIAETIAAKKTPGTGTYGDISTLVIDENGVPSIINFFELGLIPLTVEIDVTALRGYTSGIGVEIKQAVADFVNGLEIGEDSYLNRLFGPASLGGVGDGATFVVSAIRQSRDGDPPEASDVVILFKEAATLSVDDITLAVI